MSGFKRAVNRIPFSLRIQIKHHEWLKRQPESMCQVIERLIEQEMEKESNGKHDFF